MSVNVKLSTSLRNYVPNYQPEQGLLIDLNKLKAEEAINSLPAQDASNSKTLPQNNAPSGYSALDLANKLALPITDIKIVMINGRRVDLDSAVCSGDRVAFFPAVGGG